MKKKQKVLTLEIAYNPKTKGFSLDIHKYSKKNICFEQYGGVGFSGGDVRKIVKSIEKSF